MAYSMNNIVLYKTVVALALLVLVTSLSAQAPAIDLIPSSHQVPHSEAIIDTSYVLDTTSFENDVPHTPVLLKENSGRERLKKERRQIGPSMDSLFRKSETSHSGSGKKTGSITLYLTKFNPVKFFISIIALK
jgi:hypothetical protein